MNALRRLFLVGIVVGSCSSLDIMEPHYQETYECVPYAPDTATYVWPDSLRLVLGAVDEAWANREVQDGCTYESLSIPGLTIDIRDTAVASSESTGPGGASVASRAPGRTFLVFTGDDMTYAIPVVVPDTVPMGAVSSIAAEGSLSCAVEASGAVLCWGADYFGLMGGYDDPSIGTCHGSRCSPMPHPVDVTAEAVFPGGSRICYLDGDAAACRDGSGTTKYDVSFTSLTVSSDHQCGLSDVGEVLCWGWSGVGQLGTGSLGTFEETPMVVSGPSGWTAVDAGDRTTCGVSDDGHLYCWGLLPDDVPGTQSCQVTGGFKNSGPTYAPCSSIPLRIGIGAGLGADTLLADVSDGCVLTTEGGVLCAPEGTFQFSRVAAAGSYVSIESGADHHCALTADGDAHCWGENGDGQLGNGGLSRSDTPVTVAGGLVFTELALGAQHSCGLTTMADVWCWGANQVGQVGSSISESPPVPTRVRGQGLP